MVIVLWKLLFAYGNYYLRMEIHRNDYLRMEIIIDVWKSLFTRVRGARGGAVRIRMGVLRIPNKT